MLVRKKVVGMLFMGLVLAWAAILTDGGFFCARAEEKININTADVGTLSQLSGIGEVKAEAIVKYREETGKFKTIEDLKNVKGIGDATFEKIKDQITVGEPAKK